MVQVLERLDEAREGREGKASATRSREPGATVVVAHGPCPGLVPIAVAVAAVLQKVPRLPHEQQLDDVVCAVAFYL